MSSHRSRSFSSSSDDSSDVNEGDNKITNAFRNDGSFLEMFKKMQKASSSTSPPTTQMPTKQKNNTDKESVPKEDSKLPKPVPIVGRRRCNKTLPLGKVKKLKTEEEKVKKPQTTDAWAKYLEEVKKYKETYCDSETKNRSLVK